MTTPPTALDDFERERNEFFNTPAGLLAKAELQPHELGDVVPVEELDPVCAAAHAALMETALAQVGVVARAQDLLAETARVVAEVVAAGHVALLRSVAGRSLNLLARAATEGWADGGPPRW